MSVPAAILERPATVCPAVAAPPRLAVVFVAGVYLVAALPKIVDPYAFAIAMARYPFVPDVVIVPLAVFLPWVEAIAAIALLVFPAYREAASVLLLLLAVVFTAVLAAGLALGLSAPCACFGGVAGWLSHPWPGMVRNVMLIGLLVAIWRRSTGHFGGT